MLANALAHSIIPILCILHIKLLLIFSDKYHQLVLILTALLTSILQQKLGCENVWSGKPVT